MSGTAPIGSIHPRRLRNLTGLFLMFLAIHPFSSPSRAQDFHGEIAGTVADVSGGRVPLAEVTVRSADSSMERRAIADGAGVFHIPGLPPGKYEVVVRANGFAEVRSEVTIVISSDRSIAVTLAPASAHERVVVSGHSPMANEAMNATSAVRQGVVTEKDLETIPLAARSFANIAYLVPGTEPVEPSDPTKARITAVSTGGSSGLNNELSVDGADNSDDYIGGFLQNFSPDTIQEFAVRTAQEEADTGRTTAGSVVITTKRGTNDWHGNAAFYDRNAALNARFPIDNPAPDPKQPFSRQNYIGTIGGPIAKNRLWFFSSIEYVNEDASIAYSPANVTQFEALATLATEGLVPGVSTIPVPAFTPVPFRDYLATTRLDWTQSARSQWFLRGAGDNYTTQNALVQQGTLPSTGATWRSNYLNLALSNQFEFSPTWVGSFVFGASGLHLTEQRNSNLGYALAFPFSSTPSAISGFETFGDNQFVTAITNFPIERNQEKYQLRYDVSHVSGRHTPRFGVNFIHEPVLGGALAVPETTIQYPFDPGFYVAIPSQFYTTLGCDPPPDPALGITCTPPGGAGGAYSQNVQRLGLYIEDSWRARANLTINYGLRYDTTFGLFEASGRSQLENPAFLTLRALKIPLVQGAPQDYRTAFGPRLGFAYSLGAQQTTVIRVGFGIFFNDLAQNGWVNAFQAVNAPPAPCVNPNDPGCIPAGQPGYLIDPRYREPYALHFTAGVQHAFNANWTASADYLLETGMHGYRRYQYEAGFTLPADAPSVAVFRSDNRSTYSGLSLHLQGNVSRKLNLIVNYTLSKAQTWGCVLGELFDYVNGVCNPLNAFARGDYGPSGEDARHRFVLAGTFQLPKGFQVSSLFQAESARPFTLTTPADVNGLGDSAGNRAVVDGVQTSLDELRGSPYIQVDLRVSRPIHFGDRWTATPFIEMFNLFNRNNPGANYVTSVSALPVNDVANVTGLCANPPQCTQFTPVTSPNQLRVPAGALGDFFGPGTTVGIPFAAQIGGRISF
jgi:hypothetical protein